MSILSRSISIVTQGTVTSSSGSSRKVANCFCYYTTDALGAGTVNLFRATFEANVWSVIRNALHEDFIGDQYRVYFPGRVFNGGGVLTGSVPDGTVTGPRLPVSDAVNLVLRTGLRSRHYIGLKRFGPIPADHVDGDQLNATGITAWSAVVTAMSAVIVDGFSHHWRPIVQSRVLTALVPIPALIDGEEITSIDLNLTLGLARHRREPTER